MPVECAGIAFAGRGVKRLAADVLVGWFATRTSGSNRHCQCGTQYGRLKSSVHIDPEAAPASHRVGVGPRLDIALGGRSGIADDALLLPSLFPCYEAGHCPTKWFRTCNKSTLSGWVPQ